LVGRVREFLGPHADLLKMQDNLIELVQTQVRVYDHQMLKPEMNEKEQATVIEGQVQNLNFRQIELIDFLEKNRFIGVQEASQILHVPKITACRDLSDLLKQKIVTKSGQARATKYTLATLLKSGTL
jgi:Fic family protein